MYVARAEKGVNLIYYAHGLARLTFFDYNPEITDD